MLKIIPEPAGAWAVMPQDAHPVIAATRASCAGELVPVRALSSKSQESSLCAGFSVVIHS